ncbi:MAG: siroheme synthase CysG [Gammaproteobacteria bacterium]
MDYLPIFCDLKGRPVLVVGGGEVAARKVALLLQAQARVTVIAPRLGRTLQEMSDDGQVEWIERPFQPADLENAYALVYAATDSADINQQVSEEAKSKNIPVNVVDNPALCTFIMPAIVDRSPVVAAVSTGGASPVLARLIRARLESSIPAGFGRLARLVSRFRDRVKERFTDGEARRAFWEGVLQGPIAEQVFSGQDAAAEAALDQAIEASEPHGRVGEVYLIGGGPGDPDLLTFRALRLMQQADVVLYDRLVAPAVLEMVRRDAERIYVGKERDRHALPQEDINRLMVRLAREGRRVLRLKGGDPFIFGRGGEEIEKLSQEGIPFQVVPGITAASGCSSYAGIPLTHRDYAQACVFVTGHLKDGTTNLNWPALAHPRQTVVFYMGLHALDVICEQLKAHGLRGETPVALVQKGTTPEQRVFVGTLDTMPEVVKDQEIKPPSLIIVGEVVRLRDKLAWFEGYKTKPA